MISNTELDNMVLKKQLTKKFPNKVNIGFGVDDNKIKGIDSFPIYDSTDGFRSNVDSLLFSTKQKRFDVSGVKHIPTPVIQPHYFAEDPRTSSPDTTNTRWGNGELSTLYGLPPDRNIVLENPTAQAMNFMDEKMTEERFIKQRTSEEAKFLDDQRVVDILTREGALSTATKVGIRRKAKSLESGRLAKMKVRNSIQEEIRNKVEPLRTDLDANVVVTQAFPKEQVLGGGADPDAVKSEKTSPESTDDRTKEILQLLTSLDVPGERNVEVQKKIRLLMSTKGFVAPSKNIKKNSSFVKSVKKELSDSQGGKVKGNLTKKQSKYLGELMASGENVNK